MPKGPCIALDAHVHLYPGADLDRALGAGRSNLEAAARAKGHRPSTLCLLLTETIRDNAFGALAEGRLVPEGWTVRQVPGDPAALRLHRSAEDAELLLVAGHQIVTEERIEVLALACTDRVPDGRPIRTVLAELGSRGIPAVLPWGLGKWMGQRGATVAALLEETGADGLMLGDNAGRPPGWATPPLFRQAAGRNIPVLPGSDPLPVPDAEAGIGGFGFLLEGHLDPTRPAGHLRERLVALRGQPLVIGRRQGLRTALGHQISYRRTRRAAPPAPAGHFSTD